MGCRRWPNIWTFRPQFAHSLHNFHDAAMKIKDCLLMSLPIVKRFWPKIIEVHFLGQISIFLGGNGLNVNVNFNYFNAKGLQGRIQRWGKGGMPPIVDWVEYYRKKLVKVTLFSPPKVFCGPQICQKCVGGRGCAGPRWEAHDAPPDPLVGWGKGHPLSSISLGTLAPSALSFCDPQCIILARPCKDIKMLGYNQG